MKNRVLPLFGALLFLLAQIILPQGSNDVSERIASIRQYPSLWRLSHGLILLSVPFLILGFVRLKEMVHLLSPGKAVSGLLFLLIGLSAESAIAALQLVAEGIVRTTEEASAEQVLSQAFITPTIQMTLFLPYLLLLPGAALLAIPLFCTNNCRQLAIGILLFGLFMVVGGLLQAKVVFIFAGLAAVFVFGFAQKN